MHRILRRMAKLIGPDRRRGGAWNGREPRRAVSRRTRTRTLGNEEISITTADECGRSNVLRCALRANPVSRYIGPRIATTGRPRPERRVRITCKRESDHAGQALPWAGKLQILHRDARQLSLTCREPSELLVEAAAGIRSQRAAAPLAPGTEAPARESSHRYSFASETLTETVLQTALDTPIIQPVNQGLLIHRFTE